MHLNKNRLFNRFKIISAAIGMKDNLHTRTRLPFQGYNSNVVANQFQ